YLYLHRDYLGSITLITDDNGNAVEKRHFNAWGQITKYWNIKGQTTIPVEGILLDRGYTGHEHLYSVGLIHMNGRLYDPVLHRFLQPDNYVQDPFNTQNFNRYGYVLNNPLKYTDPSGEFIWAPIIIGAIMAATSYTVNAIINKNWSWKGFGLSVLGGAIMGGASLLGGTSVAALTGKMIVNTVATGIASGVASVIMPSVNIPIGNWNFSLSLSVAFGNASGIGASIGIGYSDGNWSFSAGVGIMSYGNYNGFGKNGFEIRKSILAAWDDGKMGLSLGTNFWSGDFEQRTGMIGFRHGDFSMMYENDGAPFNKLGKALVNDTDMYRTAAMRIGIGEFSIQTNLFTGKSGTDSSGLKFEDAIQNPELVDLTSGRKGLGIWRNKEADMYRLGALTVGYKGWRVGTNSEYVRDVVQNWFAHTIVSPQPGFRMLSRDWQQYYQYQTKNPYTLW
ncbi:polymorphic toxin type 23 domain-containing protein, partial [Capnocytophaga cynodegmi]